MVYLRHPTAPFEQLRTDDQYGSALSDRPTACMVMHAHRAPNVRICRDEPVGSQDYEVPPRRQAPVPGCRHGLLLTAVCACASIAYGVRRRLGYKTSNCVHISVRGYAPRSSMSGNGCGVRHWARVRASCWHWYHARWRITPAARAGQLDVARGLSWAGQCAWTALCALAEESGTAFLVKRQLDTPTSHRVFPHVCRGQREQETDRRPATAGELPISDRE
jgi:hypothetical protein